MSRRMIIINLGPVQDYSNFFEYPRVTNELKRVDLFMSVERFVVALFQFLMLSFYPDYEEKSDISTKMLVSYSILFKSNTGHTLVNL